MSSVPYGSPTCYISLVFFPLTISVQSAVGGAVKYTYCFSAEGVRPPPPPHNECPRYDTNQSWPSRQCPEYACLPTPPLRQDMTQGQFLSGIKHVWIQSVLIWLKIIWWWGSSNAVALGTEEYPIIAIAPRSTLAQIGSNWTKLCTYAKLNC